MIKGEASRSDHWDPCRVSRQAAWRSSAYEGATVMECKRGPDGLRGSNRWARRRPGYADITATVALVLAMSGGALAASR